MPFYLVIILAPKVAFLNEKGEVIVRRTMPLLASDTTIKPVTEEGTSIGEANMATKSVTSALNASNLPPPIEISQNVSTKLTAPMQSSELESIDGEVVESDETELTEINIRGFILSELDKMYNEYLISARPTLVEDESGNSLQAMCICERDGVDLVMARLAFYGVGNIVGSINVLALESSKFFRPPKPVSSAPSNVSTAAGDLESADGLAAVEAAAAAAEEAEAAHKKRTMIGEVASQIRVEQVVESIEESATMDFDYLMLLSIASTIAGIGLATNNTVAIVASMLVSPIMGPVMACTFGSIVNKWSLVHLGAVSELLSLLLCCIIGFCIGMVTIGVGTGGAWPTPEMRSRGLVDGLLIGLAIAIPSGMGVALSILGNNTSSLVGVAISASLLPPAVNCGMCLAYAACGFKLDPQAANDGSFSDNLSYARLGGISLALTIVNIGAIYVSGCLVFRLKEVAPLQDKQAFWERDTQIFRRLMNSGQNRGSTTTTAGGPLPFTAADLESQVRMLREVGSDPSLRNRLNVSTDDALLGLTSGMSLPGASGPLVSPTQRFGARRPRSARIRSGDYLDETPAFPLPPKSPRRHVPVPEVRSSTLLELYRRGDTSTGAPVAVDTSAVRTAPAHLFHSAGYSPYAGDVRPPSVAQVGHSGATGSLGLDQTTPPVDISAVKERLRQRGRVYHVKSHHKPSNTIG